MEELHGGYSMLRWPGSNRSNLAVVIPATGVNSSAVTTQLNALRPYVGYGPSVDFEDICSSNYHFRCKCNSTIRFSGQSMFGIVYTWSHGLTTNPADRTRWISLLSGLRCAV